MSIAAVISLALGLFQDFGTPRPAGEPPVDWVEGVAIMVAIFIVVSIFPCDRSHVFDNVLGYGWLHQRLAKGKAISGPQRQKRRTRCQSDQRRNRNDH